MTIKVHRFAGAIAPTNIEIRGNGTDANISIGQNAATAIPAYVDFNSDGLSTDYNARIIRNTGTNGNLCVYNTGSGGVILGAAGLDQIKIPASGQLLVGSGTTGTIFDFNTQVAGTIDAYYKFFASGGNGNYGVGTCFSNSNADADLGYWRQNTAGKNIRGAVIQSAWSSTTAGAETCGMVFWTKPSSSTSGVFERMRITPDGAVGINIVSPGALFDVGGNVSGNAQAIFARSPHDSNFRLTARNGTGQAIDTQAAKLSLEYGGAENAGIHFYRGSGATGGTLRFTTNDGTEALRMTNNQSVLVNSATQIYNERFLSYGAGNQSAGSFVGATGGGVLNVIGSGSTYANGMVLRVGVESRSSTNLVVFYTDTMGYVGGTALGVGSITTNGTTAVAYNTSSDYRLKENVQDLQHSGSFIDGLQPREYTWKVNGERGVGFLAHELQAVSPMSVTGTKDEIDDEGKPVYQAVEYGSAELIAHMIAEMKDMRARLAAAESEIALLKAI